MKLKKLGNNKTELSINGNIVLFSYDTPVAARLFSGRVIKTDKRYSSTTTKHVNQWLIDVDVIEVVPQSEIDLLV